MSGHAAADAVLGIGAYSVIGMGLIVAAPWRKARVRPTRIRDLDHLKALLYAPDGDYPACPHCPCHAADVCERRHWIEFPRPPSAAPCPCQAKSSPQQVRDG